MPLEGIRWTDSMTQGPCTHPDGRPPQLCRLLEPLALACHSSAGDLTGFLCVECISPVPCPSQARISSPWHPRPFSSIPGQTWTGCHSPTALAQALPCPFSAQMLECGPGPPWAPAPPPPEHRAEVPPQCPSSPAAAESVPRSNAAEGQSGWEGEPQAPPPDPPTWRPWAC